MKRILVLCAVIAIVYPVSAFAFAGVGFGASVGIANYSGDIFPSSGDLGEGAQYGLVVEITAVPVVDFEFHANYFEKDFVYTYDVMGSSVNTAFAFRDVSAMILVKKNIFPVPASPLKINVGGAAGYHIMNTDLAAGAVLGQPDNGFELVDNESRTSFHGMIGLQFSPPVAPMSVYGQYRFGKILAEDAISVSDFEAGLLMSF